MSQSYNPKTDSPICPRCGHYISYISHRLKDPMTKQPIMKWKCYSCKYIGVPKFVLKRWKHPITKKTPPSETEYSKVSRSDILHKLNIITADPYSLRLPIYREVALIALLYLTGARVSEIVGIKNKDKQYVVPPVHWYQIQKTDEYGISMFIVKDIPVLKRRVKNSKLEKPYLLRTVKIPYDHESGIIDHFMKYFTYLKAHQDDGKDTILFPFTQQWAWNVVKKHMGFYPHMLRHIRLSDLVKVYDFKDNQLQHFVGWANSQMASKYTHLSSDDLVKAMVNNYEMKRTLLKDNIEAIKEKRLDESPQTSIGQ